MASIVSEDVQPISVSQLAGFLTHYPNDVLLIDERPRALYNELHIRGAINLFCSPLMLRKVQRAREGAFKTFINESVREEVERNRTSTFIFYRESSRLKKSDRRIQILKKLLPTNGCERRLRYLEGGFEKFAKKFPALTESSKQESLNVTHLGLDLSKAKHWQERDPTDISFIDTRCQPVEILPYLFLGTADNAANKEQLECLGISAVLNVSKSTSPVELDSVDHKRIPVNDTNTENISRYFEEAVKYIEQIRCDNGKVLVHCKAGISRSATICLAYLIYCMQMTFEEAYDYVKKRRSAISPNFNFLGQLVAFEANLGHPQNHAGLASPSPLIPFSKELKMKLMDSPVPSSPSCHPKQNDVKFQWNEIM